MSVADTLQNIDEQITRAAGGKGEPGSGLYALLSLLANQFLGVPKAPPPKPETQAGEVEQEERGSVIERRTIDAET